MTHIQRLVICVVLASTVPLCAAADDVVPAAPTDVQIHAALTRAFKFIETDAQKWRADHECATCHHGAMTIFVINEVDQVGLRINRKLRDEISDWTKARFVPPPDAPPLDPNASAGSRIPSLAAAYLVAGSWGRISGLTLDERSRIAKNIVERQEADGSWPPPPPKNGPVPVFESRETMTLWFAMALQQNPLVFPDDSPTITDAYNKAVAWLDATPVSDTTQAHALRLLFDMRRVVPPEPRIATLLARQNSDGGWSQVPELRSDAFATGQALWMLRTANFHADRAEFLKGVSFLLATQQEDGSWNITPRTTPERPASKNVVPIKYFASAWATLGLTHALH